VQQDTDSRVGWHGVWITGQGHDATVTNILALSLNAWAHTFSKRMVLNAWAHTFSKRMVLNAWAHTFSKRIVLNAWHRLSLNAGFTVAFNTFEVNANNQPTNQTTVDHKTDQIR
jgi:hypothetical protein